MFYYCKSRYPNKLALGIHQRLRGVFVLGALRRIPVCPRNSERLGADWANGEGQAIGYRRHFLLCQYCSVATTECRGFSILLVLVGSELLCNVQVATLKARGRGGSRATPIRILVLSRAQSSFPEAENRCCVWWVKMRPS